MGLADLHLHTIYSYDGTASIQAVLTRARQIGLDVIAITDHDEIAGALKALELAPHYGVEVIPGSEITTAEGDLLALFINEKGFLFYVRDFCYPKHRNAQKWFHLIGDEQARVSLFRQGRGRYEIHVFRGNPGKITWIGEKIPSFLQTDGQILYSS